MLFMYILIPLNTFFFVYVLLFTHSARVFFFFVFRTQKKNIFFGLKENFLSFEFSFPFLSFRVLCTTNSKSKLKGKFSWKYFSLCHLTMIFCRRCVIVWLTHMYWWSDFLLYWRFSFLQNSFSEGFMCEAEDMRCCKRDLWTKSLWTGRSKINFMFGKFPLITLKNWCAIFDAFSLICVQFMMRVRKFSSFRC